MKKEDIIKTKSNIQEFRLPRYSEIPNVGLYLEQVAKYINGYLTPLGCMELTTSMISNYVKKGVIANPIRKQYYSEQIAYLFFIAIAKSVVSIENASVIIKMQKEVYDAATAYDYFCKEFECMLRSVFGLAYEEPVPSSKNHQIKNVLRSVLYASAHMVYLNDQFIEIRKEADKLDE